MEILQYSLLTVPYVVAALLGLAMVLLLFGAFQNIAVGITVICAGFFLHTFNLLQPILRLGVTIYVPDLPMVLIGFAAALRWLLRNDVPRRHAGWLVLALVFFVGLGMGLANNGTLAGVASRPEFYAIAAASYTMSFPVGQKQVRQMFKALTLLAVALLALSVCRWVVYYVPLADLLPPGGVYSPDGAIRVIGANHTLVLAQVLIVGLYFAGSGVVGQGVRLLSPLMFAGVLVLQHRSVWLAALAGVAFSLLLSRTQRTPLWQQVSLMIVVIFTAAAPIFFNANISGQLQSSAARALAGTDTVDARFANWRATIDSWRDDGPRAIALGRLPGSDSLRLIETEGGHLQRINFDAHNHYVAVLTGMGVVGLLALVWVLTYVLLGLYRQIARRDSDSATSAMLLVVLGMQIVYFMAYTVDFVQYMMLGLALAWVAGHRESPPQAARASTISASSTAAARWRASNP